MRVRRVGNHVACLYINVSYRAYQCLTRNIGLKARHIFFAAVLRRLVWEGGRGWAKNVD